MDTIADFLVSDSTPFTTKLLQGVPIKAVYSFDEHRKQGNEEQKEALTYGMPTAHHSAVP